MEKKLYRSTEDRAILGICGGIGEYLDIDPIIVRLIVVILSIFGGSGIIFYIIAAFIVPDRPGYRGAKQSMGYQGAYEETYGADQTQGEGQGTADAGVGGQYGGQTVSAPPKKRSGNSALILGLFLIGLGVYFLARMFFPWIDGRLFAAVALILIGILVIVKR